MSDPESRVDGTERISSGIAGLDDILCGGLDRDRLYLIEGTPGTGKTTLALQYLLEGSKKGETGLYVTLSESEKELRVVAARHGWSLEGLSIFELIPPEASLDPEHEQTLFHPAELELSETTKLILDRVTALKPSRVVFDSLSEMRLLAQNPVRYRRQILALKHFFSGRNCTGVVTIVVLAQHGLMGPMQSPVDMSYLSDSVIMLRYFEAGGQVRRAISVVKNRSGIHENTIREFRLTSNGVTAGPPLTDFSGVFSGTPTYVGGPKPLLQGDGDERRE